MKNVPLKILGSRARFALFIGVILVLVAFWCFQPSYKESEYRNCVTANFVEVDAFDAGQNVVQYQIMNLSSDQIDYAGYVCLEMKTEQGWKEVLSKDGKRQSEIPRTADGHFLPIDEPINGEIELDTFRKIKDGTYRLVIPLLDEKYVAVSNEFER